MSQKIQDAPAKTMSRRDALAEGVLSCRQLTARFLVGFDDTNHTRQAPGLPNHVAWCLGHCALTMHRVAEMLDGRPAPENAFFAGPSEAEPVTAHSTVPPGRFNTATVCFASMPVDDARLYPDFLRCGEIFNSACERLADAIRAAEETDLDKMAKWGEAEIPLSLLAMRMIYHNGAHAGQITDLRRALGMKMVLR